MRQLLFTFLTVLFDVIYSIFLTAIAWRAFRGNKITRLILNLKNESFGLCSYQIPYCMLVLFVAMNRNDGMNVWMSLKDLELKKEVFKKRNVKCDSNV